MTVFQYAHHIDQHLTLAINSLGTTVSDPFFQFLSMKEVWFPMYAVIAGILIWRLGWKRGLVAIFACALTVVACDQLGNLVKDTVQRLRPCWDLNMVEGGLRIAEDKGGLYGFYSAHAANSMGFAVCTLLFFALDSRHKYRIYPSVIVIWALLVGVSRIFVGKHFLGDVLVGFFVGLVFGWLFYRIGRAVINRFRL